jgi:hypothetical protein
MRAIANQPIRLILIGVLVLVLGVMAASTLDAKRILAEQKTNAEAPQDFGAYPVEIIQTLQGLHPYPLRV